MAEASLSKLDDKGVFTIVNVQKNERKVGKEIILEIDLETEEEFDGVKKFYTSRKMIVTKFYECLELSHYSDGPSYICIYMVVLFAKFSKFLKSIYKF